MLDYESFVKSSASQLQEDSASFMSLATPYVHQSQRRILHVPVTQYQQQQKQHQSVPEDLYGDSLTPRLNGAFSATTASDTAAATAILKEKLGATPYPMKTLPEGYRLTDCQFRLGERVIVDKEDPKKVRRGILRFYGKVQFQDGLWAGIECDRAIGKNDGSVDG